MLENPGAVERHVYRVYWRDGLLDVFASVAVLAIGFLWMLERFALAAIVPAVLVGFWTPARRRFIEPRLGAVEFDEQRERRNTHRLKIVLLIGAGFLILSLEVWVRRGGPIGAALNSLVAGLPAFLLAIAAVLASFLVNSPRFLIYAAILIVFGASGSVYDWQPGITLVGSGTSMLVMAIGLLAGFLRRNPIDAEDVE